MHSRFNSYTDETLASMAQKGDSQAEECLIRRYMDEIREKCHIYFIAGADSEDVIQEGMIGLFKAIQSFECGKEAAFRTYANICINRQIISAIRKASRQKHEPLNNSISLDIRDDGDSCVIYSAGRDILQRRGGEGHNKGNQKASGSKEVYHQKGCNHHCQSSFKAFAS